MDEILEKIAIKHLNRETLKTQRSGADFTEEAVWCIKLALEAAYNAGIEAAKKGS